MAKKVRKAPRTLILDIETSPLISYTWGIWQQDIALNQIKEDWYVLSWSARWTDDPAGKVMYQDQRNAKDISNDKKLLQGMWDLLDEADIIVTQNGRSFDIKKLNARFVLHGLPPPSGFKHIDTKVLARKHFGFTSHKLEYMTDKLCTKYKKQSHKKFPGMLLWTECLKGNRAAWNEMEKYNKYDVLSLEELYNKLKVWDNSINYRVYDDGEHVCTCGSTRLEKKGYAYTSAGKYQRFRCKDCGKQYQGKTNLMDKEVRKNMLVPGK